jgi:hypothetical protein
VPIYTSSGEQIEQQDWLTMMNYATNERQPEKQFCLITQNVAEKMATEKDKQLEEIELREELNSTEKQVEELREKLSKFKKSTNEENAVATQTNLEEISEEVVRDGQKIKIVYARKMTEKGKIFP